MPGDIRNDKDYPGLIQYLRESYHLVINAEGANDEQITVFQIETKEENLNMNDHQSSKKDESNVQSDEDPGVWEQQ